MGCRVYRGGRNAQHIVSVVFDHARQNLKRRYTPVSISLDFSDLLNNAAQIINSLWPVFGLPVGIALGMGLLGWIVKEIRSAIR